MNQGQKYNPPTPGKAKLNVNIVCNIFPLSHIFERQAILLSANTINNYFKFICHENKNRFTTGRADDCRHGFPAFLQRKIH